MGLSQDGGTGWSGLRWRETGERVGMSAAGVHQRWRDLRDAGHADPMPSITDRAIELYLGGMMTPGRGSAGL